MNSVTEQQAEVLARMRNVTRARAHLLPDLMSANDCPSQFLDGLGSVVGLTDDMRIVGRLTTAALWRRAIQVAPYLWGERGGHDVVRDAVRAFGDARISLMSWHDLVTGFAYPAPAFPWVMTYPPGSPTWGEYWTASHVEDVDGLLDLNFVIDAIDVLRTSGEVHELTACRYIENWDSLHRWQDHNFATLPGQYVRLANLGYVRETHGYTNNWPAYPGAGWNHVAYRVLAHIFAGATLSIRVRDNNGGSYYDLQVGQSGANNVRVYRVAALMGQTTTAIPLGDFSTDPRLYHTFIELQTIPLATGALELTVVIDGTPVLTVTDPAVSPPFAAGDVRFTATGAVVEIDWFEIMQHNPTITQIPT